MPSKAVVTRSPEIPLRVVKPYDFELTLRSLDAFRPGAPSAAKTLRLAARIGGSPVIIEIGADDSRGHNLGAAFQPRVNGEQVRSIAEWAIFAELDLRPFYRLISADPELGAMSRRLRGLKPSRPVSLFEMAVIAITEQQISLASAYAIRNRLIQSFGEQVEDLWLFPEAEVLAKAAPDKLQSVGLSRQKAGYIQDLARNVASGKLDIDGLKRMGDDEAREAIMTWKGFGPWSADYILIRGLARPDCVPLDDLGIRDVVGEYLGGGKRPAREEVAKKLEPYRPYRGLLAFYLLARHRLELKARLNAAD